MAILVEHGTILDGTGRPPQSGSLLIDGNRIAAIGRPGDAALRARATTVVDARGGTVLPGLMNLHAHIHRRHMSWARDETLPFRFRYPQIETQPEAQAILHALNNAWYELRRGATTIRDTGSRVFLSHTLKRALGSGLFHGPRIVTSGKIICMTGGHGAGSGQEADGPDAVRRAAREQLKMGADWVKVAATAGLSGMPEKEDPRMVELTCEELTAAAQEAHKRGRRIAAHADANDGIKNSLRAGIDSIEHGVYLDDEAIAMMREQGTFLVPTMSGLYNLYRREEAAGNTDFSSILRDEVIGPHRESVAMAYKAGITIATGTDTLGELVQEIEMLHDAGLPPMEAILAATRNAARVLGWEKDLGTLEAGKKADVVIVDGDPLADLSVLRRVKTVILDGHIVTAEWLMPSA
ncbi:MAG: amidohydrolase family protein [Armatimonadetes bacterium]|nr:amidohydrolase family protein [Armatimonadota bacterium]